MEKLSRKDSSLSIRRRRTMYLVVGTLALLILGLVYGWSIFATPLGEAFGWDRSLLSYTFSISMASLCGGALSASFIAKKTSIRVALILAAVCQAMGFILASILAAEGIWTLYLFYGVFAGFGSGMGYNVIVSTVNLWFPDRIGVSSGILMMGFGVGSLILGTPASLVINVFGWEIAFIAIGVVSSSILVAVSFLLRLPDEDIEQVFKRPASKKTVHVMREKTPLLKTPFFYLYFCWCILLFSAVLTLIGDSKQGALVLGIDVSFATILVGLVSVMNGTARVLAGVIFDLRNLKSAMLVASSTALIAIGGIVISFMLGLPNLYIAAALLCGFAAGCIPVTSSSFVRERFAPKDYPKNLATVNSSTAIAALISSIVVTLGRPLGGDEAIYAILFVLVLIAAIDAVIFIRLYYKKPA